MEYSIKGFLSLVLINLVTTEDDVGRSPYEKDEGKLKNNNGDQYL